MTKTALIFAHECAPHHRPQSTIGAQRPAQFAKHLPLNGWRVIVICCARNRREAVSAQDLAAVQSETKQRLATYKESEALIIPTPSLAHDGWLDRAWRANRERPALRRVLTAAKFYTGDWSQSWQPCARAAAEIVAEKLKIDVVLGEHGPDAGLFLARWFAAKHGVPWVADVRDPFLRPFRGLARRVYARVARDLVKTAAGTIAVTPVWAELDKKLLGRRVWCVPNGYDPQEFAPRPKTRNEYFTVAFAGNIRETFDIFIEGLRLFQEREENWRQLRFRYWGAAHERVAETAARAGLEALVETRPHSPRQDVLDALAGADLLLLLTLAAPPGGDEYLAQGLYPGKLFEYWGARRPVLCVPSDGGLLDDLLRRSRTGVSFSRAEAVAEYLGECLAVWRRGEELGYGPDENTLAAFTRQNLARQLADVLDEVVSK
jgi:glycosyltransferase involved in cell wall biosynthesis